MEAVGGIDGQDKLSSQELQNLQELSKLDDNQLKDKIGENNLSSFKSVLEAEKNTYLTRVDKKYEYGKEWTKEQASDYVPSLIDSIISKLGVSSTIQTPVADIIDKQKREIPKNDKIIEDGTGDEKLGDNITKEPIKKDDDIDNKNKDNKDKKESNEKLESTIWEYFNIPNNEGEALKSTLEAHGLKLDIVPFLTTYKNHIEANLVGKLNTSIVEKITNSIGIRVLNLSKIIDERIAFVDEQIEEGDYKIDTTKSGYKTIEQVRATEIKNERWIINNKLKDSFSFVDNELLPSATLLLIKNKGKNINWSYFDGEKKIEEITEMFNAKLDKDGNFDEGFFSTQNTVDASDSLYADLMYKNNINIIEGASLLDKNDKLIEANAMKWFMIAMAGQLAIEVGPAIAASVVPVAGTALGAIAGAAVGGTIDVADTFSDTEVLLDMVQSAGLVDSSFRMEKTWVDNALAALGIVPGATIAIKGGKISKFLSKIPTDELTSGMDKMKDIFKAKISGKEIPKFKNPLDNIKMPELKLPSFDRLKGNLTDVINKLPDTETIKKSLNWLKNKFDGGFGSNNMDDLGKTTKHIKDGLDDIKDPILKAEIEKTVNGVSEYLEVLKQNKYIDYTAKSSGKTSKGIIEEFQVLPDGKIKVAISIEGKNSKTGEFPLNMNKGQAAKGNEKYMIDVNGENKGASVFNNIDDFKKWVSPTGLEDLGKAEKANPKNIDFKLVEANAKLNPDERVKKAYELLGDRSLTPDEGKAILKAHKVGEYRKGAEIYNYTKGEILEKIKILKKVGFSKQEREILIRNGICGKIDSKMLSNSIYEQDLKSVRDILNKYNKDLEHFEVAIDVNKKSASEGNAIAKEHIRKTTVYVEKLKEAIIFVKNEEKVILNQHKELYSNSRDIAKYEDIRKKIPYNTI